MRSNIYLFLLLIISSMTHCKESSENNNPARIVEDDIQHEITDPHSASNFNSVKTKHLDWSVHLDFQNKILTGVATWTINNLKNDTVLVLDTDDLEIDSVKLNAHIPTDFKLLPTRPYIGAPLVIKINNSTEKVSVYYKVKQKENDTMSALQWLTPEQTFGKKQSYLYTKSEPQLSRCWLPCQDAPANKITYKATVTAPKELMVLMSAENPTEKSESGTYTFEMKEPIPTYLIAMAVGDITFRSIDNRTGVYAEPELIDKAAAEFSELPKMLSVAENLYGDYKFGRYNVLVLPLAFPIGGMENPRLTFSTPTIIAGDKSLINLIAHELAHSWAGNLVTNATWDDLWLNEGFTVYYERRIMEAMRGRDYSEMLWELGGQDLNLAFKELGKDHYDTRLKLTLKGRDPEISLSDVAYEKGALFLRMIEEVVGRKEFDSFVKEYFAAHKFQSITTEEFTQYLDEKLLSKNKEWKENVNYKDWIYKAGLPSNTPKITRNRFNAIEEQLALYLTHHDPNKIVVNNWNTHEWLHFLRNLPDTLSIKYFESLDATFHLSGNPNSEIAAIWYERSVLANYKKAYDPMKEFLAVTGRQKFLKPIYTAMIRSNQSLLAKQIFNRSKLNYHPTAQGNIQKIINRE